MGILCKQCQALWHFVKMKIHGDPTGREEALFVELFKDCPIGPKTVEKFDETKFFYPFVPCSSQNAACRSCQMMLSVLLETGSIKEFQFLITLKEDKNEVLLYGDGLNDQGESMVLVVNASSFPTSASDYIQPLDSRQINTPLAKKILQTCQADHGGTCSVKVALPPAAPGLEVFTTYFVDTKKNCLVRQALNTEFVALSYVWEAASVTAPLKCTKDSLSEMETPGYFSKIQHRLPQTVADCMEFTRKMGYRYVWIDRFCIIQDDYDQKDVQLQAMGAIYNHAVFTVVGSHGDGTYGLPGVQPSEELQYRRRATRVELDALKGYTIQARPRTAFPTLGSLWETRAWTFQEKAFSRRAFIFSKGVLHFRCAEVHWEEGIVETQESVWMDAYHSATTVLWPDLEKFLWIFMKYNERSMTYPCDSLVAIAGVLGVLAPSFPGGFHYGIPELYFSIAILWQADSDMIDRRELAKKEGKPEADIPRWTWARYMGHFDLRFQLALSDNLLITNKQCYTVEIKPMVKWFKISTDGTTRQLINDSFAKYQHVRPNEERISQMEAMVGKPAEQPGWKRSMRGYSRDKSNSPISGEKIFRHPIPFSLEELGVSYTPTAGICWSSKIWTRTARAFVYYKDKKLFHATNPNKLERQVGIATLDMALSLSEVLQVEVIAISMGCSRRGEERARWERTFEPCFTEWEISRATDLGYRAGHQISFINVMLIQWRDGLAERQGIGRVERNEWELLKGEEIEVTLA